MYRKLSVSVSVVAVVLLTLPTQVMAGGAPRLCLPIEKVTAKNAKQCSKKIADFFGKRISGVTMKEHQGQWCATISLRQEVKLTDFQKAFTGTSFFVPRKKLTLIGPAKLSITVRTKFVDGFFRDLETIDGLEVDDQARDGRGLLVTINQSHLCRDLKDATKKARPSYDSVKKILAGNNAELTDVSWSSKWHCRGVFGLMKTPDAHKKEAVAKK